VCSCALLKLQIADAAKKINKMKICCISKLNSK
jgi:hypothetical protein